MNGKHASRFIDQDLPAILDYVQSNLDINDMGKDSSNVNDVAENDEIASSGLTYTDSDVTVPKSVFIESVPSPDIHAAASNGIHPDLNKVLNKIQSDLSSLKVLLQTHIHNTEQQFDVLRNEIKATKETSAVQNQSTCQKIEIVQDTAVQINIQLCNSTD